MLQQSVEEEAEYIKESKERCRKLGINPNIHQTPQNTMTNDELLKKKESYKEILEVVKFFSNKIINSMEGTPILMCISDENGFLLDTLGDKAMKKAMSNLGIKPGIQFTEEDMGTNVITLSLKEKAPIQLIGTNHYHKDLHNSACYCVPFHYSDDDNLIGTISIMTAVILHNPFFLITLTTVVDSIERELLLRKQNREISRQQKLLYESEKAQREILQQDLIRKDEFITLITHEFKTPINVIYSAIQLIEKIHIKNVSEPVKKLLGSMKRNTFRQIRLVNNILDITKLNSEEINLNLRKMDIVWITRFITQWVLDYAEQKDIDLDFESNVESRDLIIDNEVYERILLNLISNAIKFTPEGGTIIVSINENKEDQTVDISVKDSGIGIAKDKHELIFKPFGQAENNLSRQAEGSGMGLALVKKLVEILGGSIKLESELEQGSTFTVNLPIGNDFKDKKSGNQVDGDKLMNAINVEFSDIYF
jgi:signal transduction histidine kinase